MNVKQGCRIFGLMVVVTGLLAMPADGGDIRIDGRYVSTVPTGTAPLQVDSTSPVANLNADLLDGLHAADFRARVAHVIDVGTSGGDFTSIQDAIDSVSGATFDSWSVIRIAPGVYTEAITLKPYVSLLGHGRLVTRIVAEGAGDVTAVSGAELSTINALQIEATSTGGSATGIVNPWFMDDAYVIATAASPGEAIGVEVLDGWFSTLEDTWVSARDGDVNMGARVESPSDLKAVNCEFFAQSPGNASATNYGIRGVAVSGSTQLEVYESLLNVSSGDVAFGVLAATGTTEIRRTSITGNSATQTTGIQLAGSTLILDDVDVVWSGSPATEKGVEVLAGLARISSSRVSADTAIEVTTGATAQAAYTQTNGSLVDSGGTFQCIGLYDQALLPVACP